MDKRNSGLELLRLLLMLGIVLIHTADHSSRPCHWLSYMVSFCVTGFVFLTGYFGTSFRLRKIVRLYATAGICCLLSALVEPWYGWSAYLLNSYRHFMGCWFLHAYVALLLTSPLLNAALERRGWEMPVLTLVFGWSYLHSFGCISKYLPMVLGFGSHTLLMMIGVYVVARRFKMDNWESRLDRKYVCLAALVLFAFGALGVSRYNSVFAVALSALLVSIFASLKLSEHVAKVVLFLSPSMFSIYILHNSDFNEGLTSSLGAFLMDHGVPVGLGCLMAACATFVVCLVVDLLRRMVQRVAMMCFSKGGINGQ